MEAVHSQTTGNSINVDLGFSSSSWLDRIEKKSEFNRYAITSIGFLLIGIVGGVTMGFFAQHQAWQMAVIIGFTMFSLSMMLAVAPMKWVLRSTALALIVDLIIILINVV